MKSAVKIPLLVGEHEAAVLDGQSRMANWLYNKLLEQAHALRQQYRASQDKTVGKSLSIERGLRDLIPALKEQHPFLKRVYSSPLKNAAPILESALEAGAVLGGIALRENVPRMGKGGSTRTCHDCGYVVAEGIPPEVREWDCPGSACTRHHIRDENAARNGLTRTFKVLELPCSGHWEVSSRCAWRFNGLGLTLRGSLTDSATGISFQEIKSFP